MFKVRSGPGKEVGSGGRKVKPLALDLCCGKGGWTIGLLKAGWDVIGVDIEDMGGYPSHLVFADVREIAKDVQAYFPALKFDLVVASPPCQEFSVSAQPFKKSREKFNAENPPDRSIWRACEKIAADFGVPIVIENVMGARKWMGKERNFCGSFYLWGDVPALLPIGKFRKGFHRSKPGSGSDHTGGFKFDPKDGKQWRGNAGPIKPRNGLQRDGNRKKFAAIAAMIPEELSTWIGECFYPRNLSPEVQDALRGKVK